MNGKEASSKDSVREAGGKFKALPQLFQFDFEDGSSVIAPEGEFTFSARSAADTIGDIMNVFCKLFPKACGRGGDEGAGCYTIIGPDGTKITICPPPPS